MNIIGLTGKSGSGKSYFANELGKKLEKSAIINFDSIFSEVMNEPDVVSKIYDIYGDEVVKNGQVDLDTILSNKEIFNTIYEMIAKRIEEVAKKIIKVAKTGKKDEQQEEEQKPYRDGEKEQSKDWWKLFDDNGELIGGKRENIILDWWKLPNSDFINDCDYVVYVDSSNEKRLQALKGRETHITQEDIDKRDDVLSADYDSVEYDLVIQNDHKQETVDKATETISQEIEIAHDTKYARENGYDFVLVDANPEKGFNYSYLLYMPKTPQKALVMDCLNDYEDGMPEGQTENVKATEQLLRLFKEERIQSETSTSISDGKTQEDAEQTAIRMSKRIIGGLHALERMVGINPHAPAMVPLVPGYGNEGFNQVASQLDKDVIAEVAPQIKAMIENAKSIVEERTGTKLNDRIVPLGHSKSSTFANNFAAYYPEMCEAAILGGGEFSTLPIDEVVLQIADKVSDNEQFKMRDGKVTKKITRAEFERIKKEYESTRRDYQAEITKNPDGTYNLPMNFPIGIADIEQYRDLSQFPNGKEGYRQELARMPKMVFLGEKEETKPGHYIYSDGKTLDGINVKAGDDIDLLQETLGRKDITELEIASMHNRVLEYIAATNSLFGKSTNEKLRNFTQLTQTLDMPVQSKIYEGVGHANFEYSEIAEELSGISSKAVYASKKLKEDIALYYQGATSGEVLQLDDIERAERVSPVPQLVRRFLAVPHVELKQKRKVLAGMTEQDIMKIVEQIIAEKGIPEGANMDRVYDSITTGELDKAFRTLERSEPEKESQQQEKGKSGFEDAFEDTRTSTEMADAATRTVKEDMREEQVEKTQEKDRGKIW